jgi:hypothetical protein
MNGYLKGGSALVVGIVALTYGATVAEAQQPIEIRGEVPTPQIVTVRPREVPTFDRQVLGPEFFNRTFWPSILPAYDMVPRRMITGTTVVGDTAAAPAATPAPPANPGAGLAIPDTTRQVTPPVVTPPTTPPPAGTTAPVEPARTVLPPTAARSQNR